MPAARALPGFLRLLLLSARQCGLSIRLRRRQSPNPHQRVRAGVLRPILQNVCRNLCPPGRNSDRSCRPNPVRQIGVCPISGLFCSSAVWQHDGFFRRFAFALGGRNQQQAAFAGDVFRLVAFQFGAPDLDAGGFQAVRRFVGNGFRIAGLRGGKDGYGKRFCRRQCRLKRGQPCGCPVSCFCPSVAGQPRHRSCVISGGIGGNGGFVFCISCSLIKSYLPQQYRMSLRLSG